MKSKHFVAILGILGFVAIVLNSAQAQVGYNQVGPMPQGRIFTSFHEENRIYGNGRMVESFRTNGFRRETGEEGVVEVPIINQHVITVYNVPGGTMIYQYSSNESPNIGDTGHTETWTFFGVDRDGVTRTMQTLQRIFDDNGNERFVLQVQNNIDPHPVLGQPESQDQQQAQELTREEANNWLAQFGVSLDNPYPEDAWIMN